jgi:hypothetical protein
VLFGSSRKNHHIGRFTCPRHVYTAYVILQERGVSTYINCQPYFPSAPCLIVVAHSYSAPTPHLLLFVVRALLLCFFLGYAVMDRLPMELATNITSRIVEQSYAPMDDLASLWQLARSCTGCAAPPKLADAYHCAGCCSVKVSGSATTMTTTIMPCSPLGWPAWAS